MTCFNGRQRYLRNTQDLRIRLKSTYLRKPKWFIGIANKKNKKGAGNKENVASKEETHNHNETLQEAEKDKGTSKDLVGSLDKRMADVEALVIQFGILVEGSLEKLEDLGSLQNELDELREDFKAAIKVTHLDLQAMIKREIERLRNEVHNKFQNSHKKFVESEAKVNNNNKEFDSTSISANMITPKVKEAKPTLSVGKQNNDKKDHIKVRPETCLRSMQLRYFNTLNTQQMSKPIPKHNVRKPKGKLELRTTKQ
ncbi:hypothetical protein L1987_35714 [Smallanthus sonchifolius]|uniref:Uncharacterized protein n=1 Tax=Smallanthus sonchifolius TaxID=185202 RepID=A0ACB9HC67_9ASTR|nr:hypothetical protein L1987_35714 [Smallanthus sonchifolius]